MTEGASFEARTDERLNQLEIQLSFTEDLLDTLNALVASQQQDISLLLREIASLRQQNNEPGMAAPRSLRDELPPHY